jgi:hypothetical protein
LYRSCACLQHRLRDWYSSRIARHELLVNTLLVGPQLSTTVLRQGPASQSNHAQGDEHIFHANPEDQVPAHPTRTFRLVLRLSRLPRLPLSAMPPVLLSHTSWPDPLQTPQPGHAMICNLIHLCVVLNVYMVEHFHQHQQSRCVLCCFNHDLSPSPELDHLHPFHVGSFALLVASCFQASHSRFVFAP